MDSGSPEYYSKDGVLKYFLLNYACRLFRGCGLLRIMGFANIYLPVGGEDCRYPNLPENLKKMDAAFYYGKLGSKNSRALLKQLHANAKSVINMGKLGNAPILILIDIYIKNLDISP